MSLDEAMLYLRYQGEAIGKLVKLGDAEARGVYDAYVALYGDRTNIEKQNELLVRVEAYIKRDLTLTERAELQHRFGHKV